MTFDDIKTIHSQHYFDLFAREDICLSHGSGSTVYDTQGKPYTDFLAGIAVNILGYGDPDIVNAVCSQAKALMHTSNLFYNQPQTQLTKLLTDDGIFEKVFICNSGAEANEAAIKLTRKYFNKQGGKKYKILTALNSFHGRTLATAAATGQPKYSAPFAPLPPGFIHIPFNDCVALKDCFDNDDTIAAVMLETIQGEGGVINATPEYLSAVRELTRKHGALMIIDEIQTGIMRCGNMYSFLNYDNITPDIITLAKGLGGGMPIGAMLARGDVSNAFEKGDHGTTFGGNPVACAAACAVLKKVTTPDFAAQVKQNGMLMRQLLTKLYAFPQALGISGNGMLLGLKLDSSIDGKAVVREMLQSGFIINCAGNNTLRFAPPLIITPAEIESMTAALYRVIAKASA